jgi:parvulin-like peptidyl-prolyl isomerase
MKKRVVSILLSCVLTFGLVTGCGIKSSDVVLTVGDTKVTGDVANFFARFNQAQTNMMYDYYASVGYGQPMEWGAVATGTDTKKKSDDKTYEQQTKEGIIESLEKYIVLTNHQEEYGVSVSDEDKKKISEAADKFVKDNKKTDGYKEISGSKEVVEQVLTWITVQSRMQEAIEAKADTNVSDEEAAQKSMEYVTFSYTTTDEEGNSVDLTDDEKAKLKTDAESFAAVAKESGAALLAESRAVPAEEFKTNFDKVAEEKGYTAQTATFDKDGTNPSADVVAAADKLGVGEVSGVIETETGLYVVKVTSELDREATDAKKETIVNERKQKLFDDTTDAWVKEAKPEVNKDAWKKIKFTSFNVKVYQKPAEEEPTAEEPAAEEPAAEEPTAEEPATE